MFASLKRLKLEAHVTPSINASTEFIGHWNYGSHLSHLLKIAAVLPCDNPPRIHKYHPRQTFLPLAVLVL